MCMLYCTDEVEQRLNSTVSTLWLDVIREVTFKEPLNINQSTGYQLLCTLEPRGRVDSRTAEDRELWRDAAISIVAGL